MSIITEEMVSRLVDGAYDLHVHVGPSPFNRKMDDFELLASESEQKIGGVLFKSHYESTGSRAALANKYSAVVNKDGPCTAKAFGAIVLNWPVGGLNPYAVSNAIHHGVKVIFMPTRDSANSLVFGNMPGDFFSRPGITVLDEKGALKPEVLEILDIAREGGAAVATGHISPEESLVLCEEGIRRGNKMILTHPEFPRTIVSREDQKRLADMGVFIEKCWYNIAENECTAEFMADNIRYVGASQLYMSTDRGQGTRETPAEGLRMFVRTLLEQGISEDDIYTMTHVTPRKVVD